MHSVLATLVVMGGRHKKGSRAGQWDKMKKKMEAELKKKSEDEFQAALLVAAQHKQDADRYKAEADKYRLDANKYKKDSDKHELVVGRYKQCCRMLVKRHKMLVRRNKRLTVQRQQQQPTAASSSGSPAAAQSEVIARLTEQVNALQSENVLFNQLMFRCKKCG